VWEQKLENITQQWNINFGQFMIEAHICSFNEILNILRGPKNIAFSNNIIMSPLSEVKMKGIFYLSCYYVTIGGSAVLPQSRCALSSPCQL
jgi:hypothetical protein